MAHPLAGATSGVTAGHCTICVELDWSACGPASLAVRIFSDAHFAQANTLRGAIEVGYIARTLLVDCLGKYARVGRVLAVVSSGQLIGSPNLGA